MNHQQQIPHGFPQNGQNFGQNQQNGQQNGGSQFGGSTYIKQKQMPPASNPDEFGLIHYILYFLSLILVLATFPLSMIVCLKIVTEYKRAVIFRLGRMIGAKGPGLFFV